MRVLLTGPFGNIGSFTLRELLNQGHEVSCLVQKTPKNERQASKIGMPVIWGDIRQQSDVTQAVQGHEYIVHLASIHPPLLDKNPDLAYQVNVEATQHIVDALKAQTVRAKILFASTYQVFGYTQEKTPPRTVNDSVVGTDTFIKQKIVAEEIIQRSGLEWAIYRFSEIPLLNAPMRLDEKNFEATFHTSLTNRIEILHASDAAFAIANGINRNIWEKVWLIGGGDQCQVHFRDYISRQLEGIGLGMFPENAFGSEEACGDWLDTSDSQRLLAYQRHTFANIMEEFARINAPKNIAKVLLPFMRSKVRQEILTKSPYIKK